MKQFVFIVEELLLIKISLLYIYSASCTCHMEVPRSISDLGCGVNMLSACLHEFCPGTPSSSHAKVNRSLLIARM